MKQYKDKAIRNLAIVSTLIPIISYIAQFYFSQIYGTETNLLRHNIVTIVDWLFIPINYFSIRSIDWRRGGVIFIASIMSAISGVLAHAYWQYYNIDGGHMISPQGVILPAGWAHLSFTIIETEILILSVLCRKHTSRFAGLVSILIFMYFFISFIFGYLSHMAVTIGDFLLLTCGVLVVLQAKYYEFLPAPLGVRKLRTST
jgi:hypothetical protein